MITDASRRCLQSTKMANVSVWRSVLAFLLLVQGGFCQNYSTLGSTELTSIVTSTMDTDVYTTTETESLVEETTFEQDIDYGIRYYLYTRKHPISYVLLGNGSLLNDTDFNINRPTVFVIHGFTGCGDTTSVTLLRDAFLYTEDINLVSVHWEDLAKGPNYEIAVNNTPIVAEHLSATIDRLVMEEGALLPSIHIVGFSLGAHVAGMAGSLLKTGKLSRITALDPAGPLFLRRREQYRLDSGDADFVMVLHTSGNPVSFEDPLGHVDFYPNGGKSPQPACKDEVIKLVCSHLIAPMYFAESIYKPTAFAGIKCGSWLDYKERLCQDCETVYMGPHTPANTRGLFYLQTSSREPYGLGLEEEEINNTLLDGNDRRGGRTVELRERVNGDANEHDVYSEGSSGPKPMFSLLLIAYFALARSWLHS